MANIRLGDVATWYDVHGNGESVLLLHSGFVDSRMFAPAMPPLVGHFRVYTVDRRGHGRTPDVEGPLTYEAMADDTIAFLDKVVREPALARKILDMAATQPTLTSEDLRAVAARTLVIVADDDTVSLEHTIALYRGIPDSELAIVPGTSHLLIIEKPNEVYSLTAEFLTTQPTPTYMPVRRATSA